MTLFEYIFYGKPMWFSNLLEHLHQRIELKAAGCDATGNGTGAAATTGLGDYCTATYA